MKTRQDDWVFSRFNQNSRSSVPVFPQHNTHCVLFFDHETSKVIDGFFLSGETKEKVVGSSNDPKLFVYEPVNKIADQADRILNRSSQHLERDKKKQRRR